MRIRPSLNMKLKKAFMDASSLDMVVVAFPSFSKKRIYEFRLVLVTFSTSVIPLSSRKDASCIKSLW